VNHAGLKACATPRLPRAFQMWRTIRPDGVCSDVAHGFSRA
jgi:hypothetical protein